MTRVHRAITVSVALALSALMAAPAQAQLAGKRSERRAQQQQQQQQVQKAAPEFPNASRTEPDTRASQKGVRELQTLSKLYEEDKHAELLAKAVPFAESTDNAYEKSFAYQMAAIAALETNETARAVQYFQAALDANGLDNNSHYRMMSNLAVTQAQAEQYPAAIATIDRFLSETKTEDAKYLTMKGGLLANAGRNEEAAVVFKTLYMQNPSDKSLLMNAVATLQQADKFSEANALLEEARGKGLLTEAREYRALYSGLLNDEKWRDAAKVIEDGVAKGILPQDADLSKAWSVTANRAYFDEDLDAAARFYALAAPLAEDGETWLNLAKVYNQQGKKAQTREAAQKALEKGVKNSEEATRLANLK
ncbi:hypothetical protein CO614_05025 [Lysobacteraceae bacterium NML120232]|nr:hypothetical protein CO608_08225 [Xanthomonadaceae bacterium NML08-0793]PJK12381.1 hypothetical protein CO614_05025 [Xanthomonadaceae bacterium NML120232]